MISFLSQNVSKVNPLILQNLQRLYIIRASVFNNAKLEPQNLTEVFSLLNNYKDGRGLSTLKKLDELFNLEKHNKIPEKQYELVNTSFADAMYITAAEETKNLIKDMKDLISTFEAKEKEYTSSGDNMTKIARSNGAIVDMQASETFKNWREYLSPFINYLEADIAKLNKLPLGANLNTKNENLKNMINETNETAILEAINKYYNTNFESSDNRLVSLSQLAPIVELSGTLNNLATVSMKIANDVRFLSSGPRSGYGEMAVPENEPGSSIMPGKVNPTQCEALTMVAAQVMGNNTAVSIANSSALFESNHFKPLIASNTLRSIKLLADGFRSFNNNCAVGIVVLENRMKENLKML